MSDARGLDLSDDARYTPSSVPSLDGPRVDAHAVVIGIDTYDDPAIPDLRFARADAQAVYEALVDPAVGRFPAENVKLLLDGEATARAIRSALGTWLPSRTRGEHMAVVYFAGHGAPEVDLRDGVSGGDGVQKFLVPSDAVKAELYATAVPMDQVSEMFRRVRARTLVVFLDACYSGNAGGRSFSRDDLALRAGMISDDFLADLAGEGRCVVTSCDVNEVSVESPALGHGLFTHFLVKGMRGAADLNRNGSVDVDELYDYVAHQVRDAAAAMGAKMQPVRKGEMRGRVMLTRPESSEASRARALRGRAARLQGEGDEEAAESLWREAAALDPRDAEAPAALAAIADRRAAEARAREAERQARDREVLDRETARLESLRRRKGVLREHFAAGALPAELFAHTVHVLEEEDESALSRDDRELVRLVALLVSGQLPIVGFVRSARAVVPASAAPPVAVPVAVPEAVTVRRPVAEWGWTDDPAARAAIAPIERRRRRWFATAALSAAAIYPLMLASDARHTLASAAAFPIYAFAGLATTAVAVLAPIAGLVAWLRVRSARRALPSRGLDVETSLRSLRAWAALAAVLLLSAPAAAAAGRWARDRAIDMMGTSFDGSRTYYDFSQYAGRYALAAALVGLVAIAVAARTFARVRAAGISLRGALAPSWRATLAAAERDARAR